MQQLLSKSLAIATLTLIAIPVLSADHINYVGLEAQSTSSTPAATRDRLKLPQNQSIGLLLPAVQKASETDSKEDSPVKGKIKPLRTVEAGTK
ncbi:MAG TPA: hypothetical protein VIC08_03150 [Cellvibrionaceae bacterium]